MLLANREGENRMKICANCGTPCGEWIANPKTGNPWCLDCVMKLAKSQPLAAVSAPKGEE